MCFEIYGGSKSERENARKLISIFHEIPIVCYIAEKASDILKKYLIGEGGINSSRLSHYWFFLFNHRE